MRTVAIFGGGVAGLTVAHELAANAGGDITVTVYERNEVAGGKARSFPMPDSAVDGRAALPGEHGFRFFPGYYRHVIDTMERIPYPAAGPGAVVAGNLVEASETKFARTSGAAITLPNEFPTSVARLAEIFSFPGQIDIPMADSMRFAVALVQLACSCDARRLRHHENVSWFDFVGGHPDEDSDYNRYLADGLNQRTVAASGRNVSARTVGLTLIRIMNGWLHPGRSIDRLLDGPTSDRWLKPWRREIERLGARIHVERTLTELDWDEAHGITGATVAAPDGTTERVVADAYVLATPVDDARVVAEASGLIGAGIGLDGLPHLTADWMNGIQLYLEGKLDLGAGHTIFVDSPFSLTSVSQRQFWDSVDFTGIGDGEVEAILSVDISDWDAVDPAVGRCAKDMTREEIKDAVIAQLNAHIEPSFGVSLPAVKAWFLDPAIEEHDDHRARPRCRNREALFINRTGCWAHRPEAVTGLGNLYVASDYVRTETDLATMEGANEAGRRAARGVLEQLGRDPGAVALFSFPEPEAFAPFRLADRLAYRLHLGAPDLPDSPPAPLRAAGAPPHPEIPEAWAGP